jgi:hypothetical protein
MTIERTTETIHCGRWIPYYYMHIIRCSHGFICLWWENVQPGKGTIAAAFLLLLLLWSSPGTLFIRISNLLFLDYKVTRRGRDIASSSTKRSLSRSSIFCMANSLCKSASILLICQYTRSSMHDNNIPTRHGSRQIFYKEWRRRLFTMAADPTAPQWEHFQILGLKVYFEEFFLALKMK